MDTLSIPSALTASLSAFARKAFVVGVIVALATAASSVVLAGCEKKGPAEKAGENIDKAAKDAGKAVENAGDKVKNAVD
ncbi:MAG TPA: hypothetical protein VD997_09985 [Phycisphaerales bacterium]|nr:hypothetical protein [Phycisphaerales bacterium]